ncbi:FHA domain-containing protein [Mycobacterium sp. shizuoka-1]|uniref:FHA domain-containing protein n=1 Tax=Mycobacterium sp. shizuoka-1 TaxID=2039281 RepID=UPI000C05FF90|nr:FHA domain-containing protein [Mycobacterium sp. shizuoka-1]GAY19100.1 hypothetical protein MSZK_58260 [Mycobacterium sp. shizuoka-1]
MREGNSALDTGLEKAPTLTIAVGASDYTAHPRDGAVTIGRQLPSQIRVSEPGISRVHVRIEPANGHWALIDTASRNGTYLDGQRVDSVVIDRELTVHLGNPNGVAVRLTPTLGENVTATNTLSDPMTGEDTTSTETTVDEPTANDTETTTEEATAETADHPDPDIARAGAALAARREELGLSHQELTDDHIISQSALMKFERGQHWPPERTRTMIEEYVGWEPGTLARIKAGAPIPDDESTEAITPTVQVAVAIDEADIALRGIRARAALLPSSNDPQFTDTATALLDELRRLDATLTDAARSATGRPELALTLGQVRRTYTDLMLRAARAPAATLGQRLYAVRHRKGTSSNT